MQSFSDIEGIALHLSGYQLPPILHFPALRTMAGVVLSSIISFLFPAKRGQTEDCPLPLTALPGLMTFLDVALFRSMEGQLTATICSSHTLLACWLDVKHQAQLVLQLLKQDDDNQRHSSSHDQQQQQDKSLVESLARQCLDAACDAIERLSTDRLASAGNLSDPYDSTAAASSGGGGHHHGHHGSHGHQAMTSGVGVQGIANGILESKEETGRRQPMQRRSDCWESPRLYCPDYVWADDVCSACQRWIRNLDKHPLVMKNSVDAITTLASPAPTGGGGGKIGAKGGGGGSGGGGAASALDIAIHGDSCLGPETDRQAGLLVQLIEDDLPIRLYQFRQAMEAEAVVTKRLYLVKCEYRAPFRAFLEAHQSLLRAPPMQLVDDYLEQHDKANQGDRKSAENHGDGESLEALKSKLQKLLNAPELVELLALEMEAETLELVRKTKGRCKHIGPRIPRSRCRAHDAAVPPFPLTLWPHGKITTTTTGHGRSSFPLFGAGTKSGPQTSTAQGCAGCCRSGRTARSAGDCSGRSQFRRQVYFFLVKFSAACRCDRFAVLTRARFCRLLF